MTKSFQNFGIRRRIIVGVLLPVLGLLITAGFLVAERAVVVTQGARLQTMINFATQVGVLVDNLQRERGASAIFLASKGALFGDELKAQRLGSDAALEGLRQTSGNTPKSALGDEFADQFAKSMESLGQIKALRSDIDALKKDPGASFSTYTGIIYALLGNVSLLATQNTDSEIGLRITAYIHVLYGKERAGQERATGGNGFAAHGFTPALHQRLISLIAAQQTLFEGASSFASAEQKVALNTALSDPAAVEVDRLRKIAIDSITAGHTADVKPSDWFAATSKRIQSIRDVTEKMVEEINKMALAHYDAALHELYIIGSLFLVFFYFDSGIGNLNWKKHICSDHKSNRDHGPSGHGRHLGADRRA